MSHPTHTQGIADVLDELLSALDHVEAVECCSPARQYLKQRIERDLAALMAGILADHPTECAEMEASL